MKGGGCSSAPARFLVPLSLSPSPFPSPSQAAAPPFTPIATEQPNNNHNSIRSTRSRTLHNNMLAANTVKGVSARRCTKSITRRRQTTTTAAKKGDVVSAAATADAPVVKGPIIIDGQVAHSTTELGLEVFRDLGDFASGELTGLLKPVESSWQPQDYLPDPESDSFLDEVRELREPFFIAGFDRRCERRN